MKGYCCEQNFITTIHPTNSWQILNQNLDQGEAEKSSRYTMIQLMKKKHQTSTLLINVIGDSQVWF